MRENEPSYAVSPVCLLKYDMLGLWMQLDSLGVYLTLSQIYAALANYHEHQAEVDAQIKADLSDVEELRRRAGESLLERKLRQDRAS
jgi:hypothetical protein